MPKKPPTVNQLGAVVVTLFNAIESLAAGDIDSLKAYVASAREQLDDLGLLDT